MRAKSLNKSQTEQVVKKATEIVKASGGDFIKSGILIEKICQSLPKFKDYSLWKAIDYAVDNGFFEWVKYKGYRIAQHSKETSILQNLAIYILCQIKMMVRKATTIPL